MARDPVARTEQVRGLVVAVPPDRLLQRDHVRPQVPEPVAEDLAPPIPGRVIGRQQVQGEHPHRVVPFIDAGHHSFLVAATPPTA